MTLPVIHKVLAQVAFIVWQNNKLNGAFAEFEDACEYAKSEAARFPLDVVTIYDASGHAIAQYNDGVAP